MVKRLFWVPLSVLCGIMGAYWLSGRTAAIPWPLAVVLAAAAYAVLYALSGRVRSAWAGNGWLQRAVLVLGALLCAVAVPLKWLSANHPDMESIEVLAQMHIGEGVFVAGGYLVIAAVAAIALLLLSRYGVAFYACCYAVVSVGLYLTTDLIEPAGSALLFVGALSVIAFYQTAKHWNDDDLRPYHEKKGLTVLTALVSFYAGFASFGYRLFLIGTFIVVSRQRLLYITLAALWFYPVILLILRILERGGVYAAGKQTASERPARWKVGLTAGLVALGCLMIAFVGFYLSGIQKDTIVQLMQIKNNAYRNQHPVVHTLILKLLLTLGQGHIGFVTFAQVALFAALLGRAALILYDIGLRPGKVYLIVGLFALLPNQALMSFGLVKDMMFSYCMAYLAILLFELALDLGRLRKPLFLAQLVLCMYLLKELRHNGIMPFLFVAGLLLVITVRYWRQIKLRAAACVFAAFAMIGITEGPVYAMLNVVDDSFSPYMVMFCAVGSCLNKGERFSEQTMERLEDVMSIESWANYYDRFRGNDHYIMRSPEGMDLSSFGAAEAFKIYFEALRQCPTIVLKDRLDGMDLLWDVTQPDVVDSFNFHYEDGYVVYEALGLTADGLQDLQRAYPQSGIATAYRALSGFHFAGERAEDQITDMLMWRTGAYLIFFLCLAAFWARHRLHRMWWAAMPMLGNVAAMILVLFHQSFRFVYFVQLNVALLTVITFRMLQTRRAPAPVREELPAESAGE